MKKTFFRTISLLTAGTCMLAGSMMTAGAAGIPDDLWDYVEVQDEDDNLIYDFKEVEVMIPADWEGKYDFSVSESYVSFYHPASRDAYEEALGQQYYAGVLFTVCYSQDYDFMNTLPNYQIIGSGDGGVYYVTLPSDVQGYPDDPAVWNEWRTLTDDMDWVTANITVIDPGEGIVNTNNLFPTSSGQSSSAGSSIFSGSSQTSGSEYILADSSSRYLSESELSQMTADELQMAINEIYARHHRKFVTKSIQQYFDSKSWYSGTVEASKFDETCMNQYEGKNIALMIKCMNTAPQSGSSQTSTGSVGTGSTMYATDTVNIRSNTSTNGAIMGVVPQGYSVTVTGSAVNGWIPVNYSGIKGYIRQDYLTAKATASVPSQSQTAPADSGTVSQSSGSASSSNAVSAAVQLYAGSYRDNSIFTADLMPEEYYEVSVSNITDTSFDFTVYLMDGASDTIKETMFATNTAIFTGDGTTAAYYGKQYNLFFSFPDYHSSYPDVTDMVVSGFWAIEGKTFSNNGVPGHEFS